MSYQNVLDFLARVASDPALKSKLEQSPTVEAFVAAAKSVGCEITADDVARARAVGNMPMSLSDADLDAVVGAGKSLTPANTTPTGCPDPTPPPLTSSGPSCSGPKPDPTGPTDSGPKKFF